MSATPHELDRPLRRPRLPRWRMPARAAALTGPLRGLGPARGTAAAVLVLWLILALAAPLVLSLLGLPGPQHRDPAALDLFGNPTGPSGTHPLGVDGQGRDELARILYALRSLWLISLAGTALAVLVTWGPRALPGGPGLRRVRGSDRLARLPVAWTTDAVLSGWAAVPPVLLGLALATRLGPGPLRLILPIALVLLWPALRARPGLAGLARLLAGAVAIEVSLTFLGMGPGGRQPQLGAMMAHAGRVTLAGVSAWWTLVFPGLVVLVLALGAEILARDPQDPAAPGMAAAPPDAPRPPGRPPWLPGGRLARPLGAGLGGTLLALAALALLGLVGFSGHGVSGLSTVALGRLGSALGATLSLLLGAAVVWFGLVWAALWLQSLPRGRRRGLRAPLTALLAAAPVAWVALLSLLIFSDSVGSLPILPGAGTYTGLSGHPGRWAQALVLPWLVLGALQAAVSLRPLAARGDAVRASAQQRVARSAGVPERVLARQRRRAMLVPVLESASASLPGLLSRAVVVEVAFRLPGAGALAVSDFLRGASASVAELALAAGLIVLLVWLAVDGLLALLAPGRAA